VLIIVSVILLAAFILFCASRLKKCPADKIMVVYGAGLGKNSDGTARSCRVIHGGTVFVWPIIQAYDFMDLAPIRFELSARNAITVLEGHADFFGKFTVAISTEHGIMQNAAERLRGLPVKETEELAKDIILGQLRLVIAEVEYEDTLDGRDRFLEALSVAIEAAIRQIGLKLLSVNIMEFSIRE